MRKLKTDAIVLRNINVKDVDKLYTLFTKDLGKISVRGFGVRKITSKRAGSLDSLNHIKISLQEKNSFYTLEEVDVVSSYASIKQDYKKSRLSMYLAELVLRNLEESSVEEGIFDLLVDTLSKIDQNENNSDLYVHHFEVKFLDKMGYKIPKNSGLSIESFKVIEQLGRGKIVIEDYRVAKLPVDKFLKDFIQSNLDIKIKTLDIF